MGTLLPMKTNMVWPWGVVFEVKDEYNGHQRGTYYFREPINGDVIGPFRLFEDAQHALHLANADASRV